MGTRPVVRWTPISSFLFLITCFDLRYVQVKYQEGFEQERKAGSLSYRQNVLGGTNDWSSYLVYQSPRIRNLIIASGQRPVYRRFYGRNRLVVFNTNIDTNGLSKPGADTWR